MNKYTRWENIKVFISSTFNDMHAERDYLIAEVLPHMQEWSESRRLHFDFVDLRWGVTEEESKNGNTISVCLRCIDECRPFFLCFLGQRRGWVPPVEHISSQTIDKYPALSGMLGSNSITEMEIEHATNMPLAYLLKNGSPEQIEDTCFFIRKNPFTSHSLSKQLSDIYTDSAAANPELEDKKLQDLKDDISRQYKAFQYSCRWDEHASSVELESYGIRGRLVDFKIDGRPLKDVIISSLCEMIERRYPGRKAYSSADVWAVDNEIQDSISQGCSSELAGREAEESALDSYLLKASCHPMMVCAPDGYGKHSLLCKWYSKLLSNNVNVIMRSCCTTEKSYSLDDLGRSIKLEATGSLPPAASDPFVFTKKYYESLQRSGVSVLIIDGADRIESFFKDIYEDGKTIRNGFCDELPDGFHVVFSVSKDIHDNELKDINDRLFLEDLNMQSKESIIRAYSEHSLKRLSHSQTEYILNNKATSNPLFLNTLLNEINRYGDHSSLSRRIVNYGESLETMFSAVLSGIESEYPKDKDTVISICSLLAFSRGGLSTDELNRALALLYSNTDIDRVSLILRRLKPYLNRTQARYAFAFGSFRNAVAAGQKGKEKFCHNILAAMFREQIISACKSNAENTYNPMPVHGSGEILYHYEMAENWDGLKSCFTTDEIFNMLDFASVGVPFYKGQFNSYKRNTLGHYRLFRDEDVSDFSGNDDFTLDAGLIPEQVERRKVIRELAYIFGRISRENKNSAWEFPQPHSKTCQELREKYRLGEDNSFLFFRDSFYQSASWMELSLAFFEKGIQQEALRGTLYQNYIRAFSDMMSFMDYLENFGSHQTGLSHAIEDLATGPRIIDERIRKYALG